MTSSFLTSLTSLTSLTPEDEIFYAARRKQTVYYTPDEIAIQAKLRQEWETAHRKYEYRRSYDDLPQAQYCTLTRTLAAEYFAELDLMYTHALLKGQIRW